MLSAVIILSAVGGLVFCLLVSLLVPQHKVFLHLQTISMFSSLLSAAESRHGSSKKQKTSPRRSDSSHQMDLASPDGLSSGDILVTSVELMLGLCWCTCYNEIHFSSLLINIILIILFPLT